MQPLVSRSPSKFKVRFMSAQYVKMSIRYVKMSLLCAKPSSCANYERAICQESEAEQAMLCYDQCCIFANHTLLIIFPARSLWLIIIYCYQIPRFRLFVAKKLYILLWFLRVFGILTFFKYDERVM